MTSNTSSATEIKKASTFSAFRSNNFRIFWAICTVAYLGHWMRLFGLGYLVVQLALQDGGGHLVPLYAGFVGIAQAVPGLSLGLFGGVVADRYDRRRVLLAIMPCQSVLTAVLAALTMSGHITIVAVLVITAIVSTITAFDGPARHSLIPNLVPREYLVSAIGLHSAVFNGAQLLGPVLAGLLYLPLGIGGVFAVIAAAYLVVALAYLFSRPTRGTEAPDRVGPLKSIAQGLKYIVRDPIMLWVFLLGAASQFLVRPYPQLLPAFAEGTLHVGAAQLSWLMAASGAGAFAGTFVTASTSALKRRGRFLIVTGIALGLAFFLLAIQRALPAAIVAVGILGFTAMLFQGTVVTTIHLRTPDHLRGRVLSVLTTIPLGFMPLGIGALGFVGSATGIAVSMSLAGLFFGLLALVGLVLARNLWCMTDHRKHSESDQNQPVEPPLETRTSIRGRM